MNTLRLGSIFGLLFIVACSSDSIPGPPQGLPYSAAFRTCGPADGPAVAIILASAPITSSSVPTPHVQIGIEQPVEKIVDSWTINQGMAASYIGTSNQIESAVTGVVTIKSIGSDSSVLGSAQLTFPNHGVIRGGFTARWITAPVLCG